MTVHYFSLRKYHLMNIFAHDRLLAHRIAQHTWDFEANAVVGEVLRLNHTTNPPHKYDAVSVCILVKKEWEKGHPLQQANLDNPTSTYRAT